MGYYYGYGINLTADEITPASKERIFALLDKAPQYKSECMDWIMENLYRVDCDNIDELDAEKLLYILTRGHDSCCASLAPILADVIQEAEGISLDVESDREGQEFLLICPRVPWNLEPWARELTSERVNQILTNYVAIVSDAAIDIDYHDIK